jgi:hypothetical protein
MYLLSSIYRVITPPHVSGISAAHHQEVECIDVANGTGYTAELTVSGPGQAFNPFIFLCRKVMLQYLTTFYFPGHIQELLELWQMTTWIDFWKEFTSM